MSFRDGRSASFVDRSGNVTVQSSDLSSNRDAYKLDTSCTVCGISAWTIFFPKKYCKFCYRCVCKSCSLHRAYHPERGQQERCCSACYDRFISQGVLDSMQYQLGVTNNMVRHASELLEEEKDRRSIQDATQSGLKAAVQQVEEELKAQHTAATASIAQQDQVLSQLNTDLTVLKAEIQSDRLRLETAKAQLEKARRKLEEVTTAEQLQKDSVDELKSKLTSNQDEFSRLQRMQEARKMGISYEPQKTKSSRKGLQELQAVADELKTQLSALKSQNQDLEKQLHSSPNDGLERELGKPSSLMNNPLLAQYLELQAEVDRLRKEKEAQPSEELLETEAETLRRNLGKMQDENEDIKLQMQRYQRQTAERRHRKCSIW